MVIAQANTCPVHLGSIPDAMTAVLEHFGRDIHPGDVFVLNDPSLGGMHLPDVFAVAPVFHESGLVGYAVTVVNHADIGGWAAGSMAVQSRTIFAEGVQIPPSRLVHRGTRNETFLNLLLRNVREPELFLGDLESQLAACHSASLGLVDLVDKHGHDGIDQLFEQLLDYSESLLRAELRAPPTASTPSRTSSTTTAWAATAFPSGCRSRSAATASTSTSPAPHHRSLRPSMRPRRSPARPLRRSPGRPRRQHPCQRGLLPTLPVHDP